MRRSLWPWIVIGCALLLHGPFLLQRAAWERHNDTVEIVVDDGSLRRAAARDGVPEATVWTQWRAAGATSVAFGGSGPVDGSPASEPAEAPGARDAGGDGNALKDGDDGDRRRAAELAGFVDRLTPRTLAAARAAAAAGAALGPYIPRGDTVEGFPDELDGTAAALADFGLAVGVVEFAGAAGRADLLRLLDDRMVFVHSIPERELPRLTQEQAVARFYRAVFERQARVLYVHLPAEGDAGVGEISPTRRSAEEDRRYVAAVADAVARAGLRLGPAAPAPRWRTSLALPVAAALAAGGAFVLIVEQWANGVRRAQRRRRSDGARDRRRASDPAGGAPGDRLRRLALFLDRGPVRIALALLPAAVCGLLAAAGRDELARQAAALAVAIGFPAAAVGAVVHPGRLGRAPVLRTGVGLLVVAAVAGTGAALVAGALGDVRFSFKLAQFRGVKMAHVAPLLSLIFGWAAAGGWEGAPPDGPTVADVGRRGNLPWRALVAALFVLAAGFVLVARTGHDVLPVSAAERALRDWLETTLPVRPRTKELFLGYPALVAGLWLTARPWSRGGARAAVPLLIAGAIAPVSVVNTFAHVHISLAVSAVRSGLGLLLGALLGVAGLGLSALVRRGSSRRSEAAGRAMEP